ncbi:MAG: hypothetical protein IJE88_01355, partial [Akkermansia sp.]|nr:hypothetical protein [Akkermansia sp.]
APLGVPGIINTKPSVPPRGGSTLGYYYVALRAQNSAHYVRLYGLCKLAFDKFAEVANVVFRAPG